MHPKICEICFCYLYRHPEDLTLLKCACGFTKKELRMITPQELNKHNYPTSPDIDYNLKILLYRINQVRNTYGNPMIVTSGLRSQVQQDALIAEGKSTASKSKHLTGQAVDILDKDGKLKEWIKNNVPLMETIGLWIEDFQSTPTWVHFQVVAPKSGNRFFKP